MDIKVCGMREAENIREVENLLTLRSALPLCSEKNSQFSSAMMGFIFWPKSSRYVSEPPAYLPVKAKRVGVFVDADINDICQRIEDYGLDIIQLHGHESPEFIRSLRAACGDAIATIKAFNIAAFEDLEQTKAYEGLVDYFLFDTRMPLEETGGGLPPGGTGKKFDWNVLEAYDGNTPFLLSGGIGPDDADRVKAYYHPKFIGIDLNSRFELVPGLKDAEKLKEFIKKIQE